MIALALLAAAASTSLDIPSGGSSGAAWGYAAYTIPMAGAKPQEIEGLSAIIYDLKPGWSQLFPIGWKPAQPFLITPAGRRAIIRAGKEFAQQKEKG